MGFFNMKLSGFFGLYKDHQTDAPSLLFSSINFARVSAPLCFNFLNMIKVHNTAFNKVMGEINIVPIFGSGFTSVFPITLIILCLFNIYDVYGKFLSYLGLKQFQFTENFTDDKIHEGKQLLYKGLFINFNNFLSNYIIFNIFLFFHIFHICLFFIEIFSYFMKRGSSGKDVS